MSGKPTYQELRSVASMIRGELYVNSRCRLNRIAINGTGLISPLQNGILRGLCTESEVPRGVVAMLTANVFFEVTRAVARDGKIRTLSVLKTNIQDPTWKCSHFLNPCKIDYRAAMNAEEFAWIEFLLQF